MSEDNNTAGEIDTEWTDFPVCPKCGAEDVDWWDGLGIHVNDGSEWSRDCGNCGADYKVVACVAITFTTSVESA